MCVVSAQHQARRHERESRPSGLLCPRRGALAAELRNIATVAPHNPAHTRRPAPEERRSRPPTRASGCAFPRAAPAGTDRPAARACCPCCSRRRGSTGSTPTAPAASQTSAAPPAPSSRARRTEAPDAPSTCSGATQRDCRSRRRPRRPGSGEEGRRRRHHDDMEQRLTTGAEPAEGDVGVEVSEEQRRLEEQHARVPDGGASAETRQAASWRTWAARGRGAWRRRTSYRQTAMPTVRNASADG